MCGAERLTCAQHSAFGRQAGQRRAKGGERLGEAASPLRGRVEYPILAQRIIKTLLADHSVRWPGEWIWRATDAV